MRILLLDDDPFILRLLTHQLSNMGFDQVVGVERAHEALSMLEQDANAFDVLLCDLLMPEMDGVEFVRHLKRMGYPGALVLISGEDMRILQTVEKLARAHNLQVLGTLAKPIQPAQLLNLLESSVTDEWPTPDAQGSKAYGPAALRQAIANGDLVNHYQPQVELATGKVVAVETLVRWQHPEDGLVFPDRFIKTAEENGLIDDMTRVVLSEALNQIRQWREAGLFLKVAVNISMDNLISLDFADFVASEVEKAQVPLTSLVLEITESRLMKDPVAPLDILTRLRLRHIGLSIDDFGTGYSSLAQLRDIPFDELKVDRSFVHGAHHNQLLGAIVDASLCMAQYLGIRSVAEGVEDQSDWDFVRGTVCDLAQGYYIAKPMPAEELSDWVADWETRRLEDDSARA